MERTGNLTLDEMREEVREVLMQGGLAHVADAVATFVLPSIRLRPTVTDEDSLPMGVSKFGGRPDLPEGFDWPYIQSDLLLGGFSNLNDLDSDFEYTAKDVRYPLAFVAQLNLAELAGLDIAHQLPEEGILYFFFDHRWYFEACKDEGQYRAWLTLYYPGSQLSGLHRVPHPDGLQAANRFNARALEMKLETTLTSYSAFDLTEVKQFATIDLLLTDDEYGSYCRLRDIFAEVDDEEDSPTPVHRVLGHPEPVQGNMQLDCQLESHGILDWEDPRVESLAPGAADWQLLLQIDTDDQQDDFIWGDCGRLYYWIREQDLRERNFDQVWMVLQCH